ncbi:hypothetical protein TNCV_2653611 [Trichonephila clavipes]|nr:hypothetical protein TNCV_2653611 [Trichonephila clavipes]
MLPVTRWFKEHDRNFTLNKDLNSIENLLGVAFCFGGPNFFHFLMGETGPSEMNSTSLPSWRRRGVAASEMKEEVFGRLVFQGSPSLTSSAGDST